jgi:hypothetical protein|tara:strand:+ start:164 stop:823 length:660 start_codon:yes stop_codon:yes gene_type:complete
MSIINPTYFESGLLYIPQPKAQYSANESNNDLKQAITLWEADLIENALKPGFYRLILEQIDPITGDVLVDAPDWIKNIVDGELYSYENEEKHFKGLRKIIPAYVFCRNMADTYIDNGITGARRLKTSSAEPVSATPLFVRAWNVFVRNYQQEIFSFDNLPIFKTFRYGTLTDYYFNNDNEDVYTPFLEYVRQMTELVPEVYVLKQLNMKTYKLKNEFDF